MFNIQQLVDGVAGLVLCGGGALGCCGRNGLVDGVAGLVLLLGVGWLVRRRLAVIACLKLRDLLGLSSAGAPCGLRGIVLGGMALAEGWLCLYSK